MFHNVLHHANLNKSLNLLLTKLKNIIVIHLNQFEQPHLSESNLSEILQLFLFPLKAFYIVVELLEHLKLPKYLHQLRKAEYLIEEVAD